MNYNMLFILNFFLILFANTEIEWFQQYNGSGEESHGHFILTCDDGGFLQVGESNFLPNSKIYVVKINGSGQFEWEKELNIGGHNLGNSAVEMQDGFLILGSMNRNSAIIKLSKASGESLNEYKTLNLGDFGISGTTLVVKVSGNKQRQKKTAIKL